MLVTFWHYWYFEDYYNINLLKRTAAFQSDYLLQYYMTTLNNSVTEQKLTALKFSEEKLVSDSFFLMTAHLICTVCYK